MAVVIIGKNFLTGFEISVLQKRSFSGELPALKDIGVAKNYLKEDELKILNNLVSGYFDLAEINAIEHKPMYMSDYVEQLDSILTSGNRKLLEGPGRVSHDEAEHSRDSLTDCADYARNNIEPLERGNEAENKRSNTPYQLSP